jgi:glyoxylase-like metal-dependent hydrolase (beta-lactamase superfamily II)
MHTDHAGGLHHFRGSEILVSRADMKAASGFGGLLRGYPSNRFPSWLDPTFVDFSPQPLGPFPHSLPLTEAGDVTIVPLPGHTPSQIGVVVRDGTHNVLVAGDASYTQELMLRTVVDGVSPNGAVARLTHQRIRTLAAQTPTVYLVAHDPQTGSRLAERQVIDVATLRAATP